LDKRGLVLALTGDTLHHFSFSGKDARGAGDGDIELVEDDAA